MMIGLIRVAKENRSVFLKKCINENNQRQHEIISFSTPHTKILRNIWIISKPRSHSTVLRSQLTFPWTTLTLQLHEQNLPKHPPDDKKFNYNHSHKLSNKLSRLLNESKWKRPEIFIFIFIYLLRTFCPHLGSFYFVSSSLCFGQISPLAFFRWLTETSDRNAESCNRISSKYCLL